MDAQMNALIEKRREHLIEVATSLLNFEATPLFSIAKEFLRVLVDDRFYTVPVRDIEVCLGDFLSKEGGLYKHTIMCMYYTEELLEFMLSEEETKEFDAVLPAAVVAAMLHDTFDGFPDWSDSSVEKHGAKAAYAFHAFYEAYSHRLCLDEEEKQTLGRQVFVACGAMTTHMGKWGVEPVDINEMNGVSRTLAVANRLALSPYVNPKILRNTLRDIP